MAKTISFEELASILEGQEQQIGEPALEQKDRVEEEDLGDIAAELGTEIALSTAGQIAAAGTGIFYVPVAFGTGFGASVTAQKTIGDPDVSYGRAFVNGMVNLIPASQALRSITSGTKITKEIVKEAAKQEAVRGSAIGLGEATAVAFIDEGRTPTLEELTTYGLGGAAFGGALGAASPKVAKSFSKFLGKNATQIDDDLNTGKISEQDAVNVATARSRLVGDIDEVIEQEIQARRIVDESISKSDERAAQKILTSALDTDEGSTFFQRVKAAIIPSKIVGRQVMDEAFYLRPKINSAIEMGSKIERRISAVIKARPELEQPINKYLDTGEMDDSIRKLNIAGDLIQYSDVKQDLQFKLIQQLEDYNFTNLSDIDRQNLLKTIKDSIKEKDYATREYRLFIDKDYKPSLRLEQEAKEEVKLKYLSENPDATPEVAEQQAVKYMQDLRDSSARARADKPNTYIGGTKDGILRFRSDLDDMVNLRAYLGEVKEAGERVRGTLTGLARTVYRNQADANVANALNRLGLATPTQPNNNFTKLELKGNIDTGLYVPNNVQAALSNIYLKGFVDKTDNVFTSTLNDAWATGVGLSKAVKVLLNPPSYAVNGLGGMITMLGQGMNPFSRGYGKGLKYALAEFEGLEKQFSKGGSRARQNILNNMQEMTKYGLSAANIIESDIRDSFNQGFFGRVVGNKLKPIGKAYAATDTAARYAVWTHSQRQLNKMFPNLEGEQLKIAAAKLTNDTFQNYEKLSPIVRIASRVGIMPQFVAFTAEFMRNIYNQTKYATQMLRGTFGREFGLDPSQASQTAMRLEGAKRLSALTAVIAGGEAIRTTYNQDNGVTPEREAALKNSVLPEWTKNQSILFTNISEDGKSGSYANMSYISPHAMLAEAMNAAANDEPLSSLASLLVDQFVGEGTFVAQNIYRALDNVDANGNPISDSPDDFTSFKDRLKFVAQEIFEPGFSREYEKVVESLTQDDPTYSFKDILARQVGARIQKFDVEDSARFKVKEYNQAARSAGSNYNTARDYGKLSQEALQTVYQNNNSVRKDNFDEIAKVDSDLKILGLSEEDRIQVLKNSGVSSKDIVATLEGRYNNLKLNPTMSTAEVFDDEYANLTLDQFRRKVRDVAKTDRALAKKLVTEYKSRVRSDRLGIGTKDELIRRMSVEERADYILANPERFQEFRRKGIVTKSVLLELRRRGAKF